MSVNPVSGSAINAAGAATCRKDKEISPEALADAPAAVFEESAQTEKTRKITYTSAQVSGVDLKADQKYAGLSALIESLLNSQTFEAQQAAGKSFSEIIEKYSGNLKSFIQGLKVDDATRAAAQEAVSEDGYWGVKQTAARAINFAIGLAGNDPAKLETLKAAIEKGYAEAEKSWGGSLPGICAQTRDAILKGLDEWAAK